ncbi:MAG TPA: hypothetical protein VK582_25610 [Pyrinomonadaceae bacterium]|nr:hypothetical protein [Pyrinomonadaceae bacterium]
MKFDLTLTTVLVFIVPGIVLLIGTPQVLISRVDRWSILKHPQNPTDAVLLFSAVFMCGALVDAARTVTIQPLVTLASKKILKTELPQDYFKSINKDSIGVFELIIDRAYEYSRLNQNLTLALVIVTSLRMVQGICSLPILLTLALALGWFVVCIRSQRDVNRALAGFVVAHPKE